MYCKRRQLLCAVQADNSYVLYKETTTMCCISRQLLYAVQVDNSYVLYKETTPRCCTRRQLLRAVQVGKILHKCMKVWLLQRKLAPFTYVYRQIYVCTKFCKSIN